MKFQPTYFWGNYELSCPHHQGHSIVNSVSPFASVWECDRFGLRVFYVGKVWKSISQPFHHNRWRQHCKFYRNEKYNFFGCYPKKEIPSGQDREFIGGLTDTSWEYWIPYA